MLEVSRLGSKALLFITLLILVRGSLVAQPMDLETPADSPAWWTLTDTLSPEELRSIYRNPSGSLQRYQDALKADLAPPLTKEQAGALRFYYNPTLTPELVPLWQAFHVMAEHHVGPSAITDPYLEMGRTGVSPEGIQTVLKITEDHTSRVAHLMGAVHDAQIEFITIQRQVLTLRGADERARDELERALATEDMSFLGRVTGQSEERLNELFVAWRTNAPLEASVTSLRLLKDELSQPDWSALRRYLLETAVSGMGPFVDFK